MEYIPVTLNAIRVDTSVGATYYLQNHINKEIQYVLYCSGKNVIKSDKIEELQEHQIKTFIYTKKRPKSISKIC